MFLEQLARKQLWLGFFGIDLIILTALNIFSSAHSFQFKIIVFFLVLVLRFSFGSCQSLFLLVYPVVFSVVRCSRFKVHLFHTIYIKLP